MVELKGINGQGKQGSPSIWAPKPLPTKREKAARIEHFRTLWQAISLQRAEALQQIFHEVVPYRITAYGFPFRQIPMNEMPPWARRFRRIWIENDETEPLSILGLTRLLRGLELNSSGHCQEGPHPWRTWGQVVRVATKAVRFEDLLPRLTTRQNPSEKGVGILLDISLYRGPNIESGRFEIIPLNPSIPLSGFFLFKIENGQVVFFT